MENLTSDPEYLAGYRAASKGEPFWPHNTEAWMVGFRDYWRDRNQRYVTANDNEFCAAQGACGARGGGVGDIDGR